MQQGKAINSTTEEDISVDTEVMAQSPRTKPTVFIPTSDQAREEQHWLSKMLGVLYPGHENPSVEDMRKGLTTLSGEFAEHRWII